MLPNQIDRTDVANTIQDIVLSDKFALVNLSQNNKIRMDLLKKCLGIIITQILILISTFLFVLEFDTQLLIKNKYLECACFSIIMVGIFLLACLKKTFQKVPINYIILIVWTVAESILINSFLIDVKTELVIIIYLYVLIPLFVIYICISNSNDYHSLMYLKYVSFFLSSFTIMLLFYFEIYIVYYFLVAMLHSVYLVLNMQRVFSANEYSIDDYILISLFIYLDFIFISTKMLLILIKSVADNF